MIETPEAAERVIDVRDIEPRFRHQIIHRLVEQLSSDASLQLIADHPPKPLRYQLELRFGDACKWSYLEEGPDVWRVRIAKAENAASAS